MIDFNLFDLISSSLPLLIFIPGVMASTFAPQEIGFRFYQDGTESGSTPVANEDTNINPNVDSDYNFGFRVAIQETGAAASTATCDWRVEYNRNSAGWNAVSGVSSVVKAFPSANLTDGAATTNRATNGLTDGTGSFVAGEVEEANGVIEDNQLTASNFTEQLFSLTVVSADVSNGDTINLRITYDNGTGFTTMSWDAGQNPTITVSKTPPPSTDDPYPYRGGGYYPTEW